MKLIQIERALKTELISIVDIYIVLQNNIQRHIIFSVIAIHQHEFNKRTSCHLVSFLPSRDTTFE